MHEIDDETRRELLGEALMNELRTIRQCVADVPIIKADVQEIRAAVDDINGRFGRHRGRSCAAMLVTSVRSRGGVRDVGREAERVVCPAVSLTCWAATNASTNEGLSDVQDFRTFRP